MTLLVSAAVVVRQGRVLLTRRPSGTHLAGKWEFPGGKVEPGEDPRETVVRECREECCIELRVDGIFEIVFHRYAQKDVLLLFWRCTLEHGEVQHVGVTDHAWVRPEELNAYDLPPADQPLVLALQSAPLLTFARAKPIMDGVIRRRAAVPSPRRYSASIRLADAPRHSAETALLALPTRRSVDRADEPRSRQPRSEHA